MPEPTDAERAYARLHASVWEKAADEMYQLQVHRPNRSNDAMDAAQRLAGYVGGQYRRIANGAAIDD